MLCHRQHSFRTAFLCHTRSYESRYLYADHVDAVENDNTDDIVITAGRATIGGIDGYTANSKTVLNLVDAKGNMITYTGISNFPNKEYDVGSALYTYSADSKVLKTVTIYTASVGTENIYGYCSMLWSTDANGYTYMFYVDGVPTMVTLEKSLGQFGTGLVYELSYENGAYTTDAKKAVAGYGAYATDPENAPNTMDGWRKAGMANNGLFRSFDALTFSWYYLETATIDTIDDGYFTTVAIEDAIDWADSNMKKFAEAFAGTEVPFYAPVDAETYYFDANTEIYDVTGAAVPATAISEGDVFVAFIDEDASVTYDGEAYASIIWIVA